MANRIMKLGVVVFGSMWLLGSVALAQTAGSQMAPGMMHGPGGVGMHELSGIMHDMGGQMKEMSEQMGRGRMTPAEQRNMAVRLRRMMGMMGMMSGMMGKGLTMDAGQRRQMERIRNEMTGMMRASPMEGRGK